MECGQKRSIDLMYVFEDIIILKDVYYISKKRGGYILFNVTINLYFE
jgi:hypothetical protein